MEEIIFESGSVPVVVAARVYGISRSVITNWFSERRKRDGKQNYCGGF